MPVAAGRPSLSAEAARAAVLTAEFNEKKWVWVPDDKEGYLAAWVMREHDEIAEVMLAGGGEVRHPTICLMLYLTDLPTRSRRVAFLYTLSRP